jgi:hypothetical protein
VTRSRMDGDSGLVLATESVRRGERMERLGSALARMARDLAAARRENAALRRENALLRAQLAGDDLSARAQRRRGGRAGVDRRGVGRG